MFLASVVGCAEIFPSPTQLARHDVPQRGHLPADLPPPDRRPFPTHCSCRRTRLRARRNTSRYDLLFVDGRRRLRRRLFLAVPRVAMAAAGGTRILLSAAL